MATKLGFTLVGDSIQNFARHVQSADEMGVEAIGMGDSQSLYHELWVRCTVAALNTKRAKVGPWVTNPVTRDVTVTASAIATLDDVAPGRTFLGIGPGESSVYNIGLKPASLERLEKAVTQIRELLERGETQENGRARLLRWAHRRIPIGVAASGPRSLELAGRIGDLVWICSGLGHDAVAQALEWVDQGARAGGRRLEDLEVWWFVAVNFADTKEEAIAGLKPLLAALGALTFRFTLEGKAVPRQWVRPIQRYLQEYQPAFHVSSGGDNPNVVLAEKLGLIDFFASRFAIAGTIDECVQRIRNLEKRGIDRLWINLLFRDNERFMQTLRQDLVPRLQG